MNGLLKRGFFLLSIDTELAWGGIHNGAFRRHRWMHEGTRDVIRRLIQLVERYEIRATWAVVGHLFLEKCRPVNGVKHPEIMRPSYRWFSGDWFKNDPSTDWITDPLWYGPDLVERILRCHTPQEIGCHGFSHMIIGDPGCNRECFASELRASQQAAKSWGITLKSFVFPRNAIAHLDVLAANGFSAFRGFTPAAWEAFLPTPVSNAMRVLLPNCRVTDQPRLRHGMWELPGTTFYLHRDGRARLVPMSLRVHRATLGIRHAVKEQSISHLWFHCFNLASDEDRLLEGLGAILKRVAQQREAGLLMNLTMGELAQHLNTLQNERAAVA